MDNGKFLPTREFIQPNHVFFEAGGGLSLPLEFFNQGNIAMTGRGGHFFAGAGYNWSGWMFGLEFTHDQWGQGTGTYALMQNFKNNIVEFKLRRMLSQESFSWLPSWLSFVPGLGAGVNFMTTDYYPSKRAKDEGRMNSVRLFDEGANCFFYDASLEFTFFLGTDMFIPFAGIDYNAFYDTSIGGGFAGFSRVYLGLRTYPLGIVNDVQRVRKQRKERLAALEAARESGDGAGDAGLAEGKEDEAQDSSLILAADAGSQAGAAGRDSGSRDSAAGQAGTSRSEAGSQAAALPAPREKASALISATPQTDFTPDEDGIADTATIRPGTDKLKFAPESWRIDISDPQGNPFKSWSGKGKLPESVKWDGRSDSGEVVFSRNRYTATLTVIPDARDRERITEEKLTARTTITTGILFQVIIPDKQWKIITNTIHFDADRATFDRIPLAQQEENRETLDSIARQIKQHGQVTVVIEGYANNVTNTEREDREELIPLSTMRAAAILEMLAERGLERSMLSAEGKGGANPLAQWEDRKNWWKNRRVEFIVTRKE